MADITPPDPKPGKAPWRTIYFRLEAPHAQCVSVIGDFNGWDPHKHPLQKNLDGVWECQIPLPPGRYAYSFVVDGAMQPDPRCQERVRTANGVEHCILEVLPSPEC